VSYLDEACGGDDVLRREVESLLAELDSLAPIDSGAFAKAIGAVAADHRLELPPVDETPRELGSRSVYAVLSEHGERLGGVSLKELEDEPPIEPRSGTERYQVLQAIAEGGMGRVYAALDRDLKRPVALKMMRASGDRRLEERFLEEAQVMGQLQHPNILAVHELGLTERGKLFYTMPLVRGRTLQTVLAELRQGEERTLRTWSLTRLVQLLQQVGQAVSYAHAKGVIHRDLKPANVMVGEHGEVQVLDWGLAKVMREGKVTADLAQVFGAPGQVVGTPWYIRGVTSQGRASSRGSMTSPSGSIR